MSREPHQDGQKLFIGMVAAICISAMIVIAQTSKSQPDTKDSRLHLQPMSPASRPLRESLVKIGVAQSTPVSKRPFLIVTPNKLKGRLVYALNLFGEKGEKPKREEFLVLRQLGSSKASQQIETRYPVTAPFYIFSPQFSPDGKYVLFKGGQSGDVYDQYGITIWNLKTNQVEDVQGRRDGISYLRLLWSPDSNYIAYLHGGDIEGERDERDPLQLFTYSLKTGRNQMIAQSPSVNQLAWTHQGTLLYTVLPTQNEAKDVSSSNKEATRPSIYESSADGGTPSKVIEDGCMPSPSPDGKWIAFLGWPVKPETNQDSTSDKNTKSSSLPNLYLYERGANKRTFVRSGLRADYLLKMLWTPDSKRLITLDTKDSGAQSNGRVTSFLIPTLEAKVVATLHAADAKAYPRSTTDPAFNPLFVSKDGIHLWATIEEVGPYQDGIANTTTSLTSVNLEDGTISTSLKATELGGFDWREEPSNN